VDTRTERLDVGHVVQFYSREEELAAVPGATRAFALSADAPAAARHFAVDAVRRLDAAGRADDAALVVTELAADTTALPATPLHGLGAVDALASRWGVEPLGHSGKPVWVELRR
jgi:hypothetical protein